MAPATLPTPFGSWAAPAKKSSTNAARVPIASAEPKSTKLPAPRRGLQRPRLLQVSSKILSGATAAPQPGPRPEEHRPTSARGPEPPGSGPPNRGRRAKRRRGMARQGQPRRQTRQRRHGATRATQCRSRARPHARRAGRAGRARGRGEAFAGGRGQRGPGAAAPIGAAATFELEASAIVAAAKSKHWRHRRRARSVETARWSCAVVEDLRPQDELIGAAHNQAPRIAGRAGRSMMSSMPSNEARRRRDASADGAVVAGGWRSPFRSASARVAPAARSAQAKSVPSGAPKRVITARKTQRHPGARNTRTSIPTTPHKGGPPPSPAPASAPRRPERAPSPLPTKASRGARARRRLRCMQYCGTFGVLTRVIARFILLESSGLSTGISRRQPSVASRVALGCQPHRRRSILRGIRPLAGRLRGAAAD